MPHEAYIKNKNNFVCPSTILGGVYNGAPWNTYGQWLTFDPNTTFRGTGGFVIRFFTPTQYIYYNFYRIPYPSQFALMADTQIYSPGAAADGMPLYYFSRVGPCESSAVSLLHRGVANCAFVDGHVDSLTGDGCASVDIKYTLSYKKVFITRP